MAYAAFGALTLCYYICAFLLFRKNVHMFQLNGYKHPVHKKWIKDNLEELLLRSVWALGAVLLGTWAASWPPLCSSSRRA